jgi:diguanylate cyclase (GGDEF)-like protein/PAS domain S-box-containing protein
MADAWPARRVGIARDRLLVILVAATVLAAVWIMVGPHPAATSWLWQTALDGLFTWLSFRLFRAPQTPPLGRRFWRAAAAGGLVFTFGSLLQSIDALRGAHTTAASSTVPRLLMATGVGWVALWLLTHPADVTGRERLRLWLDAATVMCAAAAFTWSIMLSAGPVPMTPAYLPVAAAGTGILLVSAFAMVRMQLSGSAPFTLAAGLAMGTSTALFGLLSALSTYIEQAHDVRPILVVRLVPDLLLAAAPRIEQLRTRSTRPAPAPRVRAAYSRLPVVAVVATQVLLVFQLWREGLGARSWGTVVGIAVITALVMLRQNLAMADNAELVNRLDRSMLQLSRQERRFRSLVQHASDITMLTDARGVVVYASPALMPVLGQLPEQVMGRSAVDVFRPDDRLTIERPLAQVIQERTGSATTQLQVRHADGSLRWLELVATSLLDDASVAGVIINIRDVTEARQLQDRLRHEASHDSLTGLPNRALLNERAERLLEAPPTLVHTAAVLLLDLDGFKTVNDILGHHIGDQLLIVVAERLRFCVRPTDTVARMGGDEFALLLPGTTQSGAISTARRILGALSEPVTIEDHTLTTSASIGICVGAAATFDALLRNADAAMYKAKHTQSGVHLYVSGQVDQSAAVSVSEGGT